MTSGYHPSDTTGGLPVVLTARQQKLESASLHMHRCGRLTTHAHSAIMPYQAKALFEGALSQMIIREWRGRAALANIAAYPAHFRTKVVPELQQLPGFLGADLAHRRLDEEVEFLVLTRWQSMEAIQGFAGSSFADAVVEPGAEAALVGFDKSVQHYEVIEVV